MKLKDKIFKILTNIVDIDKTRLIIILFCIKLITICYSADLLVSAIKEFKNGLYKNFLVNPDEIAIASVANNYINGLGYVSTGDYSHGKLRLTAWRPAFPVWIHVYGFKIYQYFNPKDPILLDPSNTYFIIYGIFLQLIYCALFIFSLFYFHNIANSLFRNHTLNNICIISYAFNPAGLYYIGPSPSYENIAVCCIIIVVGFYFKKLDQRKTSSTELIFVIFLSILSCLIRTQTLLIFAGLLFTLLILDTFKFLLYKQKFKLIKTVMLNTVFIIVAHIPILVKNYQLFNHYFLSTQSGYEFLQGHNPFARGSWNGLCYKGTPYDNYVRSHIANFEQLNEYEEGEARKNLAIQWVKENPVKEVWLIARKLAMYFLPDNYLHEKQFFNVATLYNLLFFSIFIASIVACFFDGLKGRLSIFVVEKYLILLVPIISSILISVLFFFGHRLRYYGEPFIILIAIAYVVNKIKINQSKGNFPKKHISI